MHTVIAGGRGFLGGALTAALRAAGHDISILTRTPQAREHVQWDPSNSHASWPDIVSRADAVINLAGEPMTAGRWTPKRKQALKQSRLVATQALASVIANADRPPIFLSGSAVGFYGTDRDDTLTEAAGPGHDFLTSICVEWEHAARAVERATRVVLLRTGVVLGKGGGALPELSRPFKLFVGGPLGSGHQVVSWIHVDDWVGMVMWALAQESVSGALNLTAPSPVTNTELAHALGRALHRPSVLPAPAFAVRLLLGEMADAAILNGQRVVPAKAQALGYHFAYSTVDDALRHLLS
jgi:uncharacterized protein (TIGR01777 family)